MAKLKATQLYCLKELTITITLITGIYYRDRSIWMKAWRDLFDKTCFIGCGQNQGIAHCEIWWAYWDHIGWLPSTDIICNWSLSDHNWLHWSHFVMQSIFYIGLTLMMVINLYMLLKSIPLCKADLRELLS